MAVAVTLTLSPDSVTVLGLVMTLSSVGMAKPTRSSKTILHWIFWDGIGFAGICEMPFRTIIDYHGTRYVFMDHPDSIS